MAKSLACVALTLLMLTSLATTMAHSAIQSTSGGVVQIQPPPSVRPGALESDTEIRAFNEVQDVSISDDVAVDISAPGEYSHPSHLTPSAILAGTHVCSHFLHADRIGGQPYVRVSGSVTFASEILGVIVVASNLASTDDPLGALGTQYASNAGGRGLELSSTEDSVVLDADVRTLTVNLRFGYVVDQIRVITAITPVGVHSMDWGGTKSMYIKDVEP